MDRNNCALLRCRSETRWQWPIDRKKNEHSDSVDEHSVCRFAAPNHHQQSIQCQLPGWISRGYGRIRGSIVANVSIFRVAIFILFILSVVLCRNLSFSSWLYEEPLRGTVDTDHGGFVTEYKQHHRLRA